MNKKEEEPLPSLADLEAEAQAYGRQVAREYLQRLADQHGEVFPVDTRRCTHWCSEWGQG